MLSKIIKDSELPSTLFQQHKVDSEEQLLLEIGLKNQWESFLYQENNIKNLRISLSRAINHTDQMVWNGIKHISAAAR